MILRDSYKSNLNNIYGTFRGTLIKLRIIPHLPPVSANTMIDLIHFES